MFTACLQHCRYLSLSSNGAEAELCAGDSLNCHRYRRKFEADAERAAMEHVLKQIFKLEDIAAGVDIVELTGAIYAEDKQRLDQLLKHTVPPVTWIDPDYAGVGSDWGGTKISVVYRIDHPHLKAAVGLVLGIAQATLTLGRIDYANAEDFCRTAAAPVAHSYPKTAHVAGRAETKAELQLI